MTEKDHLAELLNNAREKSMWQDIDTAPKDGREFLAYGFYVYPGDNDRTEYWRVASYDDAVPGFPWVDEEGAHSPEFFSHWQPLTAPPKP